VNPKKYDTWRDWWREHREIWSQAWAKRHEWDALKSSCDQTEFLPAALAVQETPPSPLPRVALWMICLLAISIVLWACIGQLEVVAVASGKIIPSDRVKTIQPLELSKIKSLDIKEGQSVKKGQLLMQLDPTQADADLEKIQEEYITERLTCAGSYAIIDALKNDKPPQSVPFNWAFCVGHDKLKSLKLPAKQVSQYSEMYQGQWQEYLAKQDDFQAQIQQMIALKQSTQVFKDKIIQTLPLVKQREADFKELYDQAYLSKHKYFEQLQLKIEQEKDLDAASSKLKEIQASLSQLKAQKETYEAQFHRALWDQVNQSQKNIQLLAQEWIKSQMRQNSYRLIAPVDGVVQQLVVHTLGAVVTPAQALMLIVPEEDTLEVDALLPNKDIGFVKVGQNATLKIETFPYTRFGIVPGKVTSISQDAIADEKLGLVYTVRLKLEKNSLDIHGKKIPLSPGMAVTAEIKTDHRRVIDYFLSPLLQATQESFRER
jgi:hemolysin D